MEHRLGKTIQGSVALKVLEEFKNHGTEKLDLNGLEQKMKKRWTRKNTGVWLNKQTED